MADASVEVRAHNFKRQETLERGRLRHLTPIIETVSHRIAGSLTRMLHAAVRVETGEIRQDSWERFAAELPDPTFLASSVLAPSGSRMVLHLPLPMAMALVEIRLGGSGTSPPLDRPLTDIELRLVDEVGRQVLAETVLAMEPTLPIHVSATTSVSSTQFLQMANAADTWLLIPLTVDLSEDTSFEAGLWIPSGLAAALLDAVERDQGSENTAPDEATLARVRGRVLSAKVEIAVRFPDITLSTEELLMLSPGDVVPLHREQGLPLYLTIDGARHCAVVLTPRGHRLACTVIDPSTQENS
jgi:flagellar motor switch protein FliM